MKSFVVAGLSSLVSASILMPIFGTGVASGDSQYSGQTFAKASEAVKSNGGTPVVSTTVGSQLATDDCMVTNAHKSITLDSSGKSAHNGTWLFDLNCNQIVAGPGKPGASAATAEGARAKAIQSQIMGWNRNPEYCTDPKWCLAMCDQYGGCAAETKQYLAGQS
ncbi:hypothetical protein [Mycobacterium sp. OAE908]|uniref:hypothetical protein n=1 Tax=Mycobacterium sp. OAE908 TaxID=2817899 RepID=UPI001AE585C8